MVSILVKTTKGTLISSANFALFFETCKSPFYAFSIQKARNLLSFNAFSAFSDIYSNSAPCRFVSICNSTFFRIAAHTS